MNGRHDQMIADCRDELQVIKTKISVNIFDSTVRFLNSYAVIKISGTFEVIFKEILFDYLSFNANEENKMYLTKNIVDSSSNPNTQNISKYLEKINDTWKQQFDLTVKNSDAKQALNALVQFRNDFAHGSNFSCSIENIITYFESSIFIFESLYNIINSD